MNTSIVKSTLVAAAVSLSLLAPTVQATEPSRDSGVGNVIAAQGNAALRQIRQEAKAAVRAVRPVLKTRPRMGAPIREPRQQQASNDQLVTLLAKN